MSDCQYNNDELTSVYFVLDGDARLGFTASAIPPVGTEINTQWVPKLGDRNPLAKVISHSWSVEVGSGGAIHFAVEIVAQTLDA